MTEGRVNIHTSRISSVSNVGLKPKRTTCTILPVILCCKSVVFSLYSTFCFLTFNFVSFELKFRLMVGRYGDPEVQAICLYSHTMSDVIMAGKMLRGALALGGEVLLRDRFELFRSFINASL